MRKATLLTSLLILLMLPLIAQTSPPSNPDSGSAFGIDLLASYSGAEVEAMLQVAAEEADKAIETAYTKGYHAAELEFGPKVAYWEKKATDAESAESGLRQYAADQFALANQRWNYFGAGVGIGSLAGSALTIGIAWAINQAGAHQ